MPNHLSKYYYLHLMNEITEEFQICACAKLIKACRQQKVILYIYNWGKGIRNRNHEYYDIILRKATYTNMVIE